MNNAGQHPAHESSPEIPNAWTIYVSIFPNAHPSPLEGLGHFSPSVKSKEVTDQKGNTKSSASIHGVNFRCSPRLKEMVKKNAPILVKRENLPKTGIEGRKAKMLSYLERNSYINLTDYAGLNNCTRYRASEDIKQFIKDNVIASVGYRTHRIYVLPEKEDEQN